MFLSIIVQFSICIYHVSYHIIFKINVLTYRIRIVFDIHVIFVHHRQQSINRRNHTREINKKMVVEKQRKKLQKSNEKLPVKIQSSKK